MTWHKWPSYHKDVSLKVKKSTLEHCCFSLLHVYYTRDTRDKQYSADRNWCCPMCNFVRVHLNLLIAWKKWPSKFDSLWLTRLWCQLKGQYHSMMADNAVYWGRKCHAEMRQNNHLACFLMTFGPQDPISRRNNEGYSCSYPVCNP